MKDELEEYEPPPDDEIMRELREARAEILKECGYDLHTLFNHLRSRDEAEGIKSTRREPRRIDGSEDQ